MRFELKNGEHKSVVLLWVCHEFNIDIDDLTSKNKHRELVKARALISKLLKDKKETVENIIGKPVEIPAKLQEFMKGTKQSTAMSSDFETFKTYLMEL